MSEMSEELLSALLDGECSPAEVEAALAAIERSPELKARWSRMCLTRDALAGVAVSRPELDFAAGVMAALDAEPETVTRAKVVALRPLAATARPEARPAAAVSARSLRWQRFAGLAVAASITGVVAVGGRSLFDRPIDGEPAGIVAGRADTGTGTGGRPDIVKVGVDGVISGGGLTAAELDAGFAAQIDEETASRLTDYIIEHVNSPARAGMGGALGYTRIVAQPGTYPSAIGSR